MRAAVLWLRLDPNDNEGTKRKWDSDPGKNQTGWLTGALTALEGEAGDRPSQDQSKKKTGGHQKKKAGERDCLMKNLPTSDARRYKKLGRGRTKNE